MRLTGHFPGGGSDEMLHSGVVLVSTMMWGLRIQGEVRFSTRRYLRFRHVSWRKASRIFDWLLLECISPLVDC